LYLLWYENGMQRSRAELFKKFSAFSAGAVIPYALTCLILLRAGVFQRFWFWTVSYARTYGSELTPREGLNQFANRMVLQKEHIGVMWFLIVFGMAAFLWDRRLRPHSAFVLGLLGFSFLAASVGFYYRARFFIVLYPVLAILAGAGVSAAAGLLRRVEVTKAWAFVPIIVFMLAFANALYADRGTYFTQSPYAAIREIYGVNPFPEAVAIADYIR